ncbi:methylmalonyl Co-A mutase-associated GTPase MeaB [Roseibium denhamense]|uniref:LAO/AO transport system kinase n=1 Tax=Roseibium denhamense TaxID=76305 RepID=A0ABY1N6B7_9HYPH|nr:methylmalonyl Co-A mutase-associated GTPase MeaB [Roseibium denhamense]MTI04385.1 methylmalonyl Co-A mutase-associated GTPase MeaB [Roseibium denhamense]SMP00684.1 LAO/AO transport system kinase [Roseibium denhamense]
MFPDLEELRSAGKRTLARVLTKVETGFGDPQTAAFLDQSAANPKGHVLGLTGPPGVGKSTLTDALIRFYRASGKRVGVLAVDPSSMLTGGALLGDRTRLSGDPEDDHLFVRSMAARDRLGGLSDHAVAAIVVLRAVCDLVLVETVGIGQSEGDLKQVADTVVLCIQPGSGDSLQFMKAGIMELPDVVAVTKSDMGAVARRAVADVLGALSLSSAFGDDWKVPVCLVSAVGGEGLPELVGEADAHIAFLIESGQLGRRRQAQKQSWYVDMVRTEFGKMGVDASRIVDPGGEADPSRAPFSAFAAFSTRLKKKLLSTANGHDTDQN